MPKKLPKLFRIHNLLMGSDQDFRHFQFQNHIFKMSQTWPRIFHFADSVKKKETENNSSMSKLTKKCFNFNSARENLKEGYWKIELSANFSKSPQKIWNIDFKVLFVETAYWCPRPRFWKYSKYGHISS